MSYDTPTDLKLTTDRSVSIDEDSGDLSTVVGAQYIKQAIVVDVFNGVASLKGERLTNTDVEEYRSDIEDVLEANQYVNGDVTVSIGTIESDSIVFDVETESQELALALER